MSGYDYAKPHMSAPYAPLFSGFSTCLELYQACCACTTHSLTSSCNDVKHYIVAE